MKRLFSKITIGAFELDFVNEIEMNSSWKTFTDTATIILPKKITKGGESIFNGDDAVIKKGDPVTIELGYFPELNVVFNGYVSKVENTSPVVIHCEDEMFLLKRNTITKSFKSVDLETLVGEIAGDVKFNTVDAEMGQFRISNVTPCQVLEEIKKVYLLDAFIQNKELHVGLQYIPETSTNHKLIFEKNIIDHSLEWQNLEDMKIKIKAISMLPNNKKIEIEVGDPIGEQRTAHFYNLSEKALREAAERELPKFRFSGYRGSFTTFGEPQLKHGDTVELTSYKFPERNGEYFVDGVETTFGQSGFRQIVEMGRKSEL